MNDIDTIFAKHFLSHEEREDCLAFLGYLLASVRAGHLCVRSNENGFSPHPDEIFPENENDLALLKNGLNHLPNRLISQTDSTPFRRDGECIYLQKNWELESEAISLFKRLLNDKPEKEIDPNTIECDRLTESQLKVIRSGFLHCLTIISGGPGTGKTYTAGHLIALLSRMGDLEIVLAAPTGKAAARLQSSIQAAAEHPMDLKAKTLHSLLGVNRFRDEEPVTLQADIVLVDECSMIDTKMMVRLLRSIKKGARLILLGDPFQLPPVEIGSLFADFVAYLAAYQPLRFTGLTQSLRVETNHLLTLSDLVNQGDCQSALHLARKLFIQGDLIEAIEEQIGDGDDISLFDKFRVLCPLRSGPFGVDSLNRALYAKRRWRYIPIMLTRHAKEFDLYNGDTGILVDDIALFGNKKIPAYLLPSYELAFCMSVHKCQGSEYEKVMILLPEGAQVFGRKALYTAITRAKKELLFWGSPDVFAKMVNNPCIRLSGFERRIQ